MASESDLYEPVKAFLERWGYAVKAEVAGSDVVARRGGEPPVVVELKSRFSLELVLQGVRRLRVAEQVYLAVPGPSGNGQGIWRRHHRDILRLCRLLGLGILWVQRGRGKRMRVEPVLDPGPYRPRPDKRGSGRLLKEFAERVGDPNLGGVNKRPIVTAYRQDALRLATALAGRGGQSPRALKASTGVARAGTILRSDVYGWFLRPSRGAYDLSDKGRQALTLFAAAIAELGLAAAPSIGPSDRASAAPEEARP